MRSRSWRVVLCCVPLILGPCAAMAQAPSARGPGGQAAEPAEQPTGVPIYFRGQEIGRVLVGNGSFTPQERAAGVETRLNQEIRQRGVHADEVTVVDDVTASRILGDGRLLVLV